MKNKITREHAILLLQIEQALTTGPAEEREGFAEGLLSLLKERTAAWDNAEQFLREIKDRIDPMLETQRLLGEVTAIVDIGTRVSRMASKYLDSGQPEDLLLSQAFARLGENLMALAKRKGAPISEHAAAMRADNARRN
jgi:hypothetical protein